MKRPNTRFWATMGLLLLASGCVSPRTSLPVPTPEPTPVALVKANLLRSCFPTLSPGDHYKVIRERDGVVTQQIVRHSEAIFSLTIADISADRATTMQMFPPDGPRRNGFPVNTAGMGGVAILVKNRYRIMVAPMAPAATDKELDRLVFGFRAEELPE